MSVSAGRPGQVRCVRARRILMTCLMAGAVTLLCAGAAPAPARAGVVLAGASAQQGADGTVRVGWAVTGADPALRGFTVLRLESGMLTPVASTGPAAREASDALAGLPTGSHLVSYEIAARGAVAATVTVVPPTVYKGVPSEPLAVDIATSGAVVTLGWQRPAVNGSTCSGYRVQRLGSPGQPPMTVQENTAQTTLTDRVSGLDTGVRTIEYTITSMAGEVAGGTTDVTATAFIGVPGWPATVAARMDFAGSAGVIEWTPPTQNAAMVSGYRITRSLGGPDGRAPAASQSTVAVLGPQVRRYVDRTLAPLAAGTPVEYTVTSLASGAPGSSARGGGAPGGGAPAFLTVAHTPLAAVAPPRLAPRGSQLEVTWDEPDIRGAPVTSYAVHYRLREASQWTEATQVDGAGRRATLTPVVPGREYEVQVAALDPASTGVSAWSALVRMAAGPVAAGAAATTPEAPGPQPAPGPGLSSLVLVGVAMVGVGFGLLLVAVHRLRRLRRHRDPSTSEDKVTMPVPR